MISSKKYVDETLRKYNLSANKALGQNFLVEDFIAKEIVESANIKEDDYVIEIGPGMGALTEFIVEKSKNVKVFEIDKNMVNILNDTLKDKITIENIDFLKVDIEKEIQLAKGKDIKILSNLPYYITSKIINRIILNDYPINTLVMMMQKEVGAKIIAKDNKDYNTLSVALDYQYNVSIVKHVGKNSYLPRPAIDSIVLKFQRVNPRFDVDFKTLLKVSDALFTQRRKTVLNNLSILTDNKDDSNRILESLNIKKDVHVEQLSINDIVNISKEYIKLAK